MAENNDSSDESAEKAYAAAFETISNKDDTVKKPAPASSSKPKKAARKASAKASVNKAAAKPAEPATRRKASAAKVPVAKAASKTAPIKIAASSKPTPESQPPESQPKEKTMDFNPNFAAGFNDAIAEAQDKAKEAFEKGSSMLGEYSEFAKGNVEAVVESGKVLAAGLQDMSTNLVAEGRSAFESMSSDMKELAGAKSPTDLLKLQSEMMRKHFDTAVAYGSQNSEAMLKLASETMAPLTGRVSLAVERVRKTA